MALAAELEATWSALRPIFDVADLSLSKPKAGKVRAFQPQNGLQPRIQQRARIRACNRYAIQADISRFYESVYTHTLEWAVHSKEHAKANFRQPRKSRKPLSGTSLDAKYRALMNGQSVGLPIGPDTSLIAAEMLLARVDQEWSTGLSARAMRFMDDYEICTRSLGEAEETLAALQQSLTKYELALNPAKTRIIQLPAPLEPPWPRVLRRMRVTRGRTATSQAYDLVDLFDCAFESAVAEPDSPVLKYAMGIIGKASCRTQNWPLLESTLLHAITIEPGVMREVLRELLKYKALGFGLNTSSIAEALGGVIQRHAPLSHGSEVAWALWAHIELEIAMDQSSWAAVQEMDDAIVALVALDAHERGLCPNPVQSEKWNSIVQNYEGYHSSGWLLAYECHVKDWLAEAKRRKLPKEMLAMKEAGVSFYKLLDRGTTPIDFWSLGAGDVGY